MAGEQNTIHILITRLKAAKLISVPDIFLTILQCFGKAINMRCRLLPMANNSL